MKVVPFGDSALLVNFAEEVSPAVNDQVQALFCQLQQRQDLGIQSLIPAYHSLTVRFDPQSTQFDELADTISHLEQTAHAFAGNQFSIPVCYDQDKGLDWATLMESTKLSHDAIVKLHTSQTFRVYLLGFLPGFIYLGELPAELHCSRLKEPRLHVPAGSVGLAGNQTGVYPQVSPGGWQIIGQTPVPLLNFATKDPFWIQAGDRIQFHSVTSGEFADIQQRIRTHGFFPEDWIVEV